jgi:L-seryl-tRNA(Ser) seleniumtransferase
MKHSEGKGRITRRRLLKTGAGVALGGMFGAGGTAAAEVSARKSVYDALGIKPVINAQGSVTVLGGSVMPPEVVAAWVDAAKHFVPIVDLQKKAAARIAELLHVEAALITTGAAGAILLGTAAAVTRGKREYIQRIPDTTGMKNEVILQKAHHSIYDHQMRDVGVKLVDANTPEEVERAVNERTAMMFFMNHSDPDGQIKRKEWVDLARRHKVPTLIDAAADVPPVERLAEYFNTGFDMIAVSGGKAMRGPNDTGLLLGRTEFIEAGIANTNPNASIGRMMKVSKEDMIAVLYAVERFAHLDPKAEWNEWLRKISVIEKAVKDIPTIKGEQVVPEIANHVPHLHLSWDQERVKISGDEVGKQLRAGDPPIILGGVTGIGRRGGNARGGPRRGSAGITISVLTLQDGEERIVAERVRAILKKAAT